MAKETPKCVFITTNKDTRLGLCLDRDDSVSLFKEKISIEHERCFPSLGKITVSALKVNLGGQFYHLSDSIILSNAIQGIRTDDWYLFADVEMLTLTPPCSNLNPNLKSKVAEEKTKKRKIKTSAGDKKSQKKPALGDDTSSKGVVEAIGIEDPENDVTNAITPPALKAMDCVNESPKGNILGNEATNVIATTLEVIADLNESPKGDLLPEAIGKACPASNSEASSSAGDKEISKDHMDQSLVAENEGLKDCTVAASESVPNPSGEKITNTLVLLAVPRGNETDTKEIGEEDADEATDSVKLTKKTRTKKAKAPAKENTGVTTSAADVGPGTVVSDSQENVDKVVKKSSKKSKKKPTSNVVEEA